MSFNLDPGAQCNVMPLKMYETLCRDAIQRSRAQLVSYSGHKINALGKANLCAGFKKQYHLVTFQIVDANVTPVIGLQTCLEMKLVRK